MLENLEKIPLTKKGQGCKGEWGKMCVPLPPRFNSAQGNSLVGGLVSYEQ